MKSRVVAAVVFVCLFAGPGLGTPNTEIWYETTDLGSGRWEYTYTVVNLPESLIPEIREFTVWFKYGDYYGLVVTTPETPAGWDQIVVQPEPVLEDDGFYDAVTLTVGIGIGESISGFSVSFDWLPGTGEPGSQFYEIIDPVTFETIESGMTVPEPTTILLVGLGGLVLLRKRHRNRHIEKE